MIRLAKASDINNCLSITKACASNMVAQNIYQWNEHYPNKKAFVNDLERNELYVFENDNAIVGCITISTFMDAIYHPVKWLTSNANNIYIHRLAVHPKYQGNGFAQKLMDYAEDHAKKHSFDSIRLDTFSQNKRNLKFYEARGYRRLEDIYFPKQSAFPFYCYELVL
ncbi:GNAT family N-acetyltransferase [Seonamhaeicola sp.]|uniref:GNAT family N-acetyltransferase n=1 Tax=Seonamhaeicola sp. TaxID=1912245 RepID=UPI00261CB9BE|nr:GNAT family N-acetyltransferase [Seonamhaeicola sp.]